MEGPSDGEAEQAPLPVASGFHSFWTLHLQSIPDLDDALQDKFCATLKTVFKLEGVPKRQNLPKHYCKVSMPLFTEVFQHYFQQLPASGRLTALHDRLLSGLVVKNIRSRKDSVVLCYHETPGIQQVWMIDCESGLEISEANLRASKGIQKIPLRLLLTSDQPLYRLVCFSQPSLAVTVGDQPSPQRISKRHRKSKGKRVAKVTEEEESSDSEPEPDADACREDAQTLLDAPSDKSRKPGSKKNTTEVSDEAGESVVTARSKISRQSGPTLSELDNKFVQLTEDFHSDLVVALLSDKDARALQESLKKRFHHRIDGALSKDPSEQQHDDVAKKLKASQRIDLRTRSRALDETATVGVNDWALDTGFLEYLQATYKFKEENIKKPDGEVRSETSRHRHMLYRNKSDFENLPEHPYRGLCLRHPDKSRLIVFIIKHSVSNHWNEYLPECQKENEELRFGVVVDEHVYLQMDPKTRGLIVLEPIDKKSHGFSHFIFDEVIESPEPMNDETMTALCTVSTPELYKLCDKQIRERLAWKMEDDGGGLHEYMEERLLGVIRIQYEEHNANVLAAQQQKAQQEEKRRKILEYNQLHPDSPRKLPALSLDKRLNGSLKEPVIMKIPDKINLMLFPFPFMMVCANNMRLEHGPHCRCCGPRIRNPITGPLYEDAIHNCTAGSFRRLKTTIPRYFVGGLCSCFPLCNTYKSPY
jgi:hypothetical protein